VQLKTHPIELPEPLEDGSVKSFWFSHFLPETEIQLRRRKSGKSISTNWQNTEDRRPKTEQRSPVAGLWFIISIVALVGKQSNDRRNRRRFPSLSTSVRFYCFRTSPSVRLPADILLYISGVSSIFPVFIWFIRFAVLFWSPRSPQINKYIVR